MPFSTDRLLLRAVEPSDVKNVIALASFESQITSSPTIPRLISEQDALGLITLSQSNLFQAILVLKSDPSVFVGQMGLEGGRNVKNREAILFVSLVEEHQRKGYGTEAVRWSLDWAFKNANMHRVSLSVYEGNDSAIAMYKKLGFTQEGIKRKCNWVNGEWKDVISMGILSDEWEKQS